MANLKHPNSATAVPREKGLIAKLLFNKLAKVVKLTTPPPQVDTLRLACPHENH